eukprot:scaffold40707_cov34-Tisochrysis_lutea.AAC.2
MPDSARLDAWLILGHIQCKGSASLDANRFSMYIAHLKLRFLLQGSLATVKKQLIKRAQSKARLHGLQGALEHCHCEESLPPKEALQDLITKKTIC